MIKYILYIMVTLSSDNFYILSSLILSVPLIWGVYEFRKFRFQLKDIKDKADNIDKTIDDIAKNNLKDYPLLMDVKEVVDKVNKVFKPE